MSGATKSRHELQSELEALHAHVAELERAESARKRAEERLRLLSSAVEQTHEGIAVVNMEGDLVFLNDAFATMHGYAAEELVGRHLSVFHTPEQIPSVDAASRQIKEIGEFSGEIWHVRRDGTVFPTLMHNSLLRDEAGKPVGIIGTVRDITERKQAEKALRVERDFAEGIIQTAQVIVLVLDTQGRIVRFNPFMEGVSGYRLEEVKGRDWFTTFLPKRDQRRIRDLFLGLVSDIQTRGNVNPIVAKDGRERDIEWYGKTLKDADGNVIGVLAIGQDITERKSATAALRESEKRYQDLYDNAPDMFVSVDAKTAKILRCNQTLVRTLGYEKREIIGRLVFDLYTPESADQARKHVFPRFVETGEVHNVELQLRRKDGRAIDVSLNVSAIRDDLGQVVASRSVWRDVAERKRAEEALRESERFLQNVFAAIDDGISVLDRALNIVRVNPWIEKSYARQAPLTGKKCYAVYQQRQTVCPWCPSVKAMESGETQRAEVPYPCEEDPIGWIDLSAYPLKNADGQVVGVIECVKDITHRKRAEEALRESEARYQELFDSIMEGIGLVDENEVVRFCNPAYVRIFEEDSADELLGRSLLDYVPEGQRDALLSQTELRKKNVSSQYELDVVTRKNNRKTILASVSPRFDADMNYVGAFGAILDITERKQAEQQVQAERDRAQRYLDLAGTIIVAINADEKVILINRKGCEVLGYSEEEIVGRNWFDTFLLKEQGGWVRDVFRHLMAGDLEPVEYVENPVLTASGEQRIIAWHNVLLRDDAGCVIGTLSSGEDITERKRAEEELARHREHLEELVEQRTRELAESRERLIQAERLASVGTLAAGIAHEINNPVGGMLLAAQNAQQHRTGPDGDQIVDRALDKIVDQAKRCSRIVKSVLQFARDDTTDKWPTDLNGILRRVVDLTRKHARERGAEVALQPTEDLGKVVVSPVGLERVLVNIIDNGIEAREAGARVVVRAEGTPEAVRIELRDNGRGLTDEQLKHLFDPFFTTRQDSGGTGLGLSIAHGIVTDHGGRISVDSQVGRGTTVVVELPRRTSSQEEAAHVEGAGG